MVLRGLQEEAEDSREEVMEARILPFFTLSLLSRSHTLILSLSRRLAPHTCHGATRPAFFAPCLELAAGLVHIEACTHLVVCSGRLPSVGFSRFFFDLRVQIGCRQYWSLESLFVGGGFDRACVESGFSEWVAGWMDEWIEWNGRRGMDVVGIGTDSISCDAVSCLVWMDG